MANAQNAEGSEQDENEFVITSFYIVATNVTTRCQKHKRSKMDTRMGVCQLTNEEKEFHHIQVRIWLAALTIGANSPGPLKDIFQSSTCTFCIVPSRRRFMHVMPPHAE